MKVVELPDSTRTAAEAAQAFGCQVGQIVKSLVFMGKRTLKPILVVASGANRVNESRIEALIDEPLGKADAEFVRQHTGFIRHDRTHPGRAECGTVHFAPNSERDYDWGNPRLVPSYCDAWLSFPDLTAPTRWVNAAEWGGGDTRAHHQWWLAHVPHVDGQTYGVSHNWWEYVVDPNRVD